MGFIEALIFMLGCMSAAALILSVLGWGIDFVRKISGNQGAAERLERRATGIENHMMLLESRIAKIERKKK